MMTKYDANSRASSFSILAGSRSGPQALEGLSFSSSFTTPSSVILISDMDGNDVPSGVGMSSMSSFVHVDSYCRSRMSALSLGSAWSFQFSLSGAMPLLSLRSDLMKLKKNAFASAGVPGLGLQLLWYLQCTSSRTAVLLFEAWPLFFLYWRISLLLLSCVVSAFFWDFWPAWIPAWS